MAKPMPLTRVMRVLGVVVTTTVAFIRFMQMKFRDQEYRQKKKGNALQLWAATAHPATDLKIFVGTQSQLKLEAVQAAFSDLNRSVSVVGFKAKSRVSEQPYGHEETRRGAMNRLSHTKALAEEHSDKNSFQASFLYLIERRYY
eukprot:CAMPEP_0185255568 /NCGR_PEP_ID=MMETSP1359-20130426/4637_1 /TAXON_ID=552665 /ORGANISM="Bigelowiella longifila, Strain CCMP242" /LENGTH=143 /DNA_ID=CAMNT_0027839597 /DNA_START=24 /DNA_END=455 /DNA_ORIENTATION=+